ncbi:MAG: hypothetical protein WAO57_09115 [Syntrophomonadaceae bacterium]
MTEMAKGFNLKAVFDADTKGIEEGSQKAIKSVEEFADQSSDMLDQMAGKFGVNTKHLKEFRQVLKEMGQAWVEGFGGGEEMMGNVISKMALLGTTATAAAALVAGAFKLMKEEADAYRQTIEGSIGERGLQAYLSTYQQVLRQVNLEATASMVEMTNNWRKGLSAFWADFKNMAVNAIYNMKSGLVDFGSALGLGLLQTKAASGVAKIRASEVEQLAKDIMRWERDLIAMRNAVIDKEIEILESQKQAQDRSLLPDERKQYLDEAKRLINERAEMQLQIMRQITAAYKEIADILPENLAAQEAYNAALDKQKAVERDRAGRLRALVRLENSIADASAKYSEELRKQAELLERKKAFRASLIGAPATDAAWALMPGGAEMQIEVPIKLRPPEEKEITEVMVELSRVIEDSIQSMAYGIGELIGNLATGGDAMESFGKAVLSTFAEAAIAVGKMAIQMGLAAEGVKQALKFGNPYVAIAAGAALVALGAAVKAGMSNIASGSYASSSSYSQGARAVGTSGLVTRELTVNVQGTLVAQGSQLVAVLNNENKRRKVTT